MHFSWPKWPMESCAKRKRVSRTCLALGITRRSLINQNPLEFLMQSMLEEAERSLLMNGSLLYPSLIAVRMSVSSSSLEEDEREGELEKMDEMDWKGVSGRRDRALAAQLFSPGM